MYLCRNLSEVIFDATCKASLSDGAIAKTALRSIRIPQGTEIIGHSCFSECTELSEVIFEDGCKVKRIGDYAFHKTALKSIRIPDSVEIIGKYGFHRCQRLEEVVFETGSRVKVIREMEPPEEDRFGHYDSFGRCNSHSEVSCEGVVLIASNAFASLRLKCVKVGSEVTLDYDFGPNCRIERIVLPGI
jgi:hypothetical protein